MSVLGRQGLCLLRYRLVRSLEYLKDKECYADGNTHIRHVEDAGAEVPDAEIHEIDDVPIMEHTIQEVAHSTAQHETPRNRKQR